MFPHLCVGVGGEVGNDLFGGDAVREGPTDAVPGDHACYHVGESVAQVDEQIQHSNLQR